MNNQRSAAIQYAHEHRTQFLDKLIEFASIPSVSTDPERKKDVQRAASWIANHLKKIGVDQVEILSTTGHPIVYGEYLKAGANVPTILIYGHYDVQPPEPLELWQNPAFNPTKIDDNLYARGISDMKGQIMVSINAIESIIQTNPLPVNVKFLIEGEEEIGSPSLDTFLLKQKERLACDFCLNLDAGIISEEIPSITYALRGLAYFELHVYGASHDLHSGLYGGVVHNPAQVLCELIAGMHDDQGRVTLPGFYSTVRSLVPEERAELAKLPTNEAFYLKNTGAAALFGEAGYSYAERVGARPTLEVNGLSSGFTGEGSKTVLPAVAMAKISMRLVPDQYPEEVYQQLCSYLENHAPATVRWEVSMLAGGPASITDRKMPAIVSYSQALEQIWGKSPLFKREGGSIPVVSQIQKLLGIKSLIGGFGLPDDNAHAPNEKLHLPTWYRGIDTIIHFFYNLVS